MDDQGMTVGTARPQPRGRPQPISATRAVMVRLKLSATEASRRLGIGVTVVKRIMRGQTPTPTLTTAAKWVYGSRGQISFEDLIPPKERAELKRLYWGALFNDERKRKAS